MLILWLIYASWENPRVWTEKYSFQEELKEELRSNEASGEPMGMDGATHNHARGGTVSLCTVASACQHGRVSGRVAQFIDFTAFLLGDFSFLLFFLSGEHFKRFL